MDHLVSSRSLLFGSLIVILVLATGISSAPIIQPELNSTSTNEGLMTDSPFTNPSTAANANVSGHTGNENANTEYEPNLSTDFSLPEYTLSHDYEDIKDLITVSSPVPDLSTDAGEVSEPSEVSTSDPRDKSAANTEIATSISTAITNSTKLNPSWPTSTKDAMTDSSVTLTPTVYGEISTSPTAPKSSDEPTEKPGSEASPTSDNTDIPESNNFVDETTKAGVDITTSVSASTSAPSIANEDTASTTESTPEMTTLESSGSSTVTPNTDSTSSTQLSMSTEVADHTESHSTEQSISTLHMIDLDAGTTIDDYLDLNANHSAIPVTVQVPLSSTTKEPLSPSILTSDPTPNGAFSRTIALPCIGVTLMLVAAAVRVVF